ncbi:MAG TPA: ABC transporter permease [Micromonosporaceae bacterium]
MAFDESIHRRDARDAQPIDSVGGPDPGAREVTRADLDLIDDLFDDPTHGEPGRDRMAVHLLWETVLLVGIAVLVLRIHRDVPHLLSGDELNRLLVAGAALGLLAVAAGLTLRAAVPNLALGPITIIAARYFDGNPDPAAAIGPALLAATLLGLALAVIVVGLHVPAWAASLAVGLAVIALVKPSVEVFGPPAWDPLRYSGYLAGGVAALSVLGGLFGMIKVIRRTLGRFRPVADPAQRRGVGAAVVSGAVLLASVVLAVFAGALLAAAPQVWSASALEWSGLALGAALLGGASAFGRRGGIFGNVLAIALLTLTVAYVGERGWDVGPGAVAAGAILLGLVVTRLVETFGRPRPVPVGDDGSPDDPSDDWRGPWSDPQDSWSFPLPAQPTDRRSHLRGR